MESVGSGVEYTSADDCIIVGIGTLSVVGVDCPSAFPPLPRLKLGRGSLKLLNDIFPSIRRAADGS